MIIDNSYLIYDSTYLAIKKWWARWEPMGQTRVPRNSGPGLRSGHPGHTWVLSRGLAGGDMAKNTTNCDFGAFTLYLPNLVYWVGFGTGMTF